MDVLWRDVRWALRALARNPGFTTAAVGVLAVSMGAGAAVFGIVEGVLLRPLPIAAPERVVSFWLEGAEARRARMTPGNFVDLANVDGVFESVAAFGARTASFAQEGNPAFLRGSAVTPDYFRTLGVAPLRGRTFRADDADAGRPVVILSHHVWQQMLGADPDIIGRSVTLDGASFEVLGIAPPGVYPTEATVSAELPFTSANQDFFVLLRYGPQGWANRRSHVLGAIGRLAPGVEPDDAHARLAALTAELQAIEPLNRNERFLMTSFTEEVVGDVRLALVTLLANVGLVLLIAVVNVAALFALRAEDRRPELAVRTALGAPRARLVRQVALESTLVAIVSATLAIVIAHLALRAIHSLVPYQIPRLDTVTIGGAPLALTLATGFAVAVVFGALPAARIGRGVGGSERSRSRDGVGTRERRLQATVVAFQAALSVVVLVGAALLTRSYAELRSVDAGFDAHDAWVMSIPTRGEALQEITREVRALPGVEAAAVAYDHPLQRNWGDGFRIVGQARSDTDPPTSASLRPFGPGYFETVGIDVVVGRAPDEVDMAEEIGPAVVNETFARTFFPEGSPLGRVIEVPTAQRIWGSDGRFTIVGVVADVRFLGPRQPAGPALYVPLSHFPTSASTLLVRASGDDAALLAAVREIVSRVDPTVGVQEARPLGDILDDLLARPRFNMFLLAAFGTIGLALCALGTYGLVSRVVSTRTHEIAVRLALGARAPKVAGGVLASAARPMLAGMVVGLLVAGGLARTIESLLFGVSHGDVLSFVAGPLLVLVAGLLAATWPTLRALAVDPAVTLRAEP